MRPRVDTVKKTKTQTSMVIAESFKDHRPRSADIVRSLSVCSAKRGSRQLTHVDLPSVPLMIDSPTVCRRSAAVSDAHSATNGFDTDFRTSTIKKQPNFFNGKAHLPLTESTRQIHSVSMRFFNEHMDSSSTSTTSSSKTTASTEDENDSDEELPVMNAEFPPPPSPLPADLCVDFCETMNETCSKLSESMSKMKSSTDATLQSARMTLSSTSLYDETHRKSSLSIGQSTSMSVAPSSSAMFADDGQKFKRPPPPLPPKRSETTRLTTTVNDPISDGDSTKSNDFGAENLQNGSSMRISIKSNDSTTDSSPKTVVCKTKSQPTNDFHNELQRATFRRLQQLQSTDADSTSTKIQKPQPPPLPPKKV